MVNYDELPLFPLNTVLYPGMPLPLHIFEPRYLEMVNFCVEHHAGFGVVLIKSGSEVGEAAEPHHVGTVARITHVESTDDNGLNIVVVGESRFRILETTHKRSYLTAVAAPVSEVRESIEELASPTEQATDLFRAYLRSQLALNKQSLSAMQLPHDPSILAYAIAQTIQVPLEVKQILLELSSTSERLDREIDILGHEIASQAHKSAPVSRRSGENVTASIQPADGAELRKIISRN